jgi:hypothetical protein
LTGTTSLKRGGLGVFVGCFTFLFR